MEREVDEIRIIRRDGYFGVTLPITVRLYDSQATATANYTTPFFTAQRTYEVIEFSQRHETAEVTAARTLQLRKVPDGTAPASGTNILSSGIDLQAAANTLQYGTISQTLTDGVPVRRITRGDSLCLIMSGAATELRGVTATVLLKAI